MNSLPFGAVPSSPTLDGKAHFLITLIHTKQKVPPSLGQRWRSTEFQSTFSVSSITFCSFATSPPICHATNKESSSVSNSSHETRSWLLLVLSVLASNTTENTSGGMHLQPFRSNSESRKRGNSPQKLIGWEMVKPVEFMLHCFSKSLGKKTCAGSSILLLAGDGSIVNNNGGTHKFLINIPGKYPLCITLRCC